MQNKKKAIFAMLIAGLSFSLMTALVKLSGDLPAYEKVFFRSFVSTIILFIWIKNHKKKLLGKRKHQKYLILRTLFGTAAMFFYFYGIANMLLADSAMLGRLNPFFVTLFAWVFLREKPSKIQIPALIIAFGAALLIIKPGFNFNILPALSIIAGALFSAAGHTMLRFFKNKEAPETIIFYFSIGSTIFLLIPTFLTFEMPTTEQWIYLILIGVFAVTGQFGLTFAYKLWFAAEVAIYGYVGIIYAIILGYIFWSEIPDIWSIIGGIIIFAVGLVIFLYDRNKHSYKK